MTRAGGHAPGHAPRPAVDLHCHVLPGLDDGARDLDDAVEMAWQGHADGLESICATPHIRHDHDVRIAELSGRRAELAAALSERGCPVLILPGGEVAVTALDGLDEPELQAVSLGGGGRWILLEPPPGPLDERTEAAVETLARRSFRALIAHPERHAGDDLIDRLSGLIAVGALVQVTAALLIGPGRELALELARAGVVHVLASDAHSSRAGRPVEISPALEVLRTVAPCGSHLDWIAQAAPRAIVRGDDPVPPYLSRRP